jgi:hypothetical protein
MPQDVDYAVVRQNLEEGGIRSIPAFKNFLDNAHMIVEPEAEGRSYAFRPAYFMTAFTRAAKPRPSGNCSPIFYFRLGSVRCAERVRTNVKE